MNTTLLTYSFMFLTFIIIVILILRKTDNDKIKEIGNFLKKVLPTIPITKIVELLQKK
ncbi:MAG TPA: hypothetical protein VKZ45_09770 [Vicingaceae bacterium]|nr:hypothetical protein [Vicingaceae bacterium]